MLGKNMKVTQFSVRTPSPLDCLLLHCPTLWPPPTLWPLLLDNLIQLELLTHRYKQTHTMVVVFLITMLFLLFSLHCALISVSWTFF